MIINTLNVRNYRIEITHDGYVNVFKDDQLIDWPGPWEPVEGATMWAADLADHLVEHDL